MIFQNVEDFFYKKLKMDRVFDVKAWPFLIKVKDVQGRTMIGAIFKKRSEKPDAIAPLIPRSPDAEEPGAAWDMIIQAKTAQIKFDFAKHEMPSASSSSTPTSPRSRGLAER